ncbi:MAG: autotransporter-associated beta strand repeat-containing protein [Planctomycetes bacterium]|nr:autotransporter-associated beta strand repeat-containing protein [Planctomycetota bacterium]
MFEPVRLTSSFLSSRLIGAAALALALLCAAPAHAANVRWDGGGADGQWSNPLNWKNDAVPGSGDSVAFPANYVTAPLAVNLSAPVTVGALTLATSSPVSFTGATITVNKRIVVNFGSHSIANAIDGKNGSDLLIIVGTGSSLALSGAISVSNNKILALTRDGAVTMSGALSGTGVQLVVGGAGSLTLSGASTYTGSTSINGGTVMVVANAPVLAAGPFGDAASAINIGNIVTAANISIHAANGVTIGRPVTVSANATGSVTVGAASGAVSFAGAITLERGATLSAPAGATATFSGAISGAGFGVTKSGAGTGALDNALNTYTGATTVAAGVLLANGATQATGTAVSTVTVASGATLGGAGRIAGTVSVAAGGTLAPGNASGIGTLTVNGDVTVPAGAILRVHLNGATPSQSGKLAVTAGTVSLAGNLVVNLSPASVFSTGWTILDKGAAGAISGTFAGKPEGAAFAANGRGLQITYVAEPTATTSCSLISDRPPTRKSSACPPPSAPRAAATA